MPRSKSYRKRLTILYRQNWSLYWDFVWGKFYLFAFELDNNFVPILKQYYFNQSIDDKISYWKKQAGAEITMSPSVDPARVFVVWSHVLLHLSLYFSRNAFTLLIPERVRTNIYYSIIVEKT